MEREAPSTPPRLTGIYEAYHRKVVAYAAKLLGSDLAEDIAQEVFVKVGRSLDALSDDTKLTSWIYAITINTVRDHARRHGAEAGRLVAAQAEHEADEAPIDPLSRLADTLSRSPEQSAIRSGVSPAATTSSMRSASSRTWGTRRSPIDCRSRSGP
jgi:RNA polymerase sigma factor (sigma-70 family)